MWWTAGGTRPPVPLSSTVYGVPVLFLPRGRRQASADSGVSSGSLSAVGTCPHPSRMWRSPTGLSDTASFRGRTGRLRRTVRNPPRSDRSLLFDTVACQSNPIVGNSGQAFERWSVPRSGGAYPRRERRGIAPVPPIVITTHSTITVAMMSGVSLAGEYAKRVISDARPGVNRHEIVRLDYCASTRGD